MSEGAIQQNYVDLLRRNADAESYQAGDTIFAEGDLADRMYIVDSGNVAISIDGQVVETVTPGHLFGELAVIDRNPRSATATAESDCQLIAIDKRRFWFLVQETPYFAEIVMRVMASRIRVMNRVL
jgi:CRP-like cAMP-binding protein